MLCRAKNWWVRKSSTYYHESMLSKTRITTSRTHMRLLSSYSPCANGLFSVVGPYLQYLPSQLGVYWNQYRVFQGDGYSKRLHSNNSDGISDSLELLQASNVIMAKGHDFNLLAFPRRNPVAVPDCIGLRCCQRSPTSESGPEIIVPNVYTLNPSQVHSLWRIPPSISRGRHTSRTMWPSLEVRNLPCTNLFWTLHRSWNNAWISSCCRHQLCISRDSESRTDVDSRAVQTSSFDFATGYNLGRDTKLDVELCIVRQ